jgi:DNA invertase Pin-like site-specific DNA recombinase
MAREVSSKTTKPCEVERTIKLKADVVREVAEMERIPTREEIRETISRAVQAVKLSEEEPRATKTPTKTRGETIISLNSNSRESSSKITSLKIKQISKALRPL